MQIVCTRDMSEACKDADVIIEVVPEDLELKKSVYKSKYGLRVLCVSVCVCVCVCVLLVEKRGKEQNKTKKSEFFKGKKKREAKEKLKERK